MKILVSVHVIWWNASADYAVTAAQALARRGHDVKLLAYRDTPAFGKAKDRGLPVIGHINLRRQDPVTFFRNQKLLGELWRAEEFDILNPHRPEDHFHLAWAKRRNKGAAKLIRTVSDVRSPKGNIFNKILHEKWTDGLIYCAQACRVRYHEKFRLGGAKEKVIYSGLDVDEFTRGDWRSGNPFFDLGSPRIGIIARLSPNKGHHTLIKAAARVRREVKSAAFIVVGKEEEVSIVELQNAARRHGVADAFTFTGHLEDPRPAVAACDIGVVASTDSEVISRAAQEFFAFGIPVVASRINVLPEIVEHGVNGLLVRPGDADELAAAILELAKSEEQRKAFGAQAAIAAKERHDLSVLGRETEEFFRQILTTGTQE
jgi:glycosyltransferase involved in cell wall biosynthesis